MMKEFWEDFDVENKLKLNMKKFKFLDIDDPIKTNAQEMILEREKLLDLKSKLDSDYIIQF